MAVLLAPFSQWLSVLTPDLACRYPTLPKALQIGFIQAINQVLISTDPTEVATYENVTLAGATGRRLLVRSPLSLSLSLSLSSLSLSLSRAVAHTRTQHTGMQHSHTAQVPDVLASCVIAG